MRTKLFSILMALMLLPSMAFALTYDEAKTAISNFNFRQWPNVANCNAELEIDDVWVGTLPNDTVITFKVAVRNIGDQPLIITRVNKSCNCTDVDYPLEIASHQTDTATFTVYTRKIVPGRFTKYVTFVSNDPDYTRRYYYSGEIKE